MFLRRLNFNCDGISSDFCPASCSQELKEKDIGSDCCTYSRSVLYSSVSDTNDILDECGVDHAGLCIGAFSGEPIVSAGLSTVVVNYLILVASLLIVMTL